MVGGFNSCGTEILYGQPKERISQQVEVCDKPTQRANCLDEECGKALIYFHVFLLPPSSLHLVMCPLFWVAKKVPLFL